MLSAIAGAGISTIAPASASVTEQFVGHARFEAQRSSSNIATDPEVFVADQNAPQASAALGIMHSAGFRAARLADSQALPLYNAQGDGLSLSLGRWLGGGGSAEFLAGDDGNGAHVNFTFTGLVPFGVYSLFISHSTPDGTMVVPFSDTTNTITTSIDGFVQLSAVSSTPLETGDHLLLVYHSDGIAHGQSRGDLGVNAHDQLILPVVAAAHRKPADSTSATVPTPQEDEPTATPTDEPATPPPSPAAHAADPNTDDVFVPTVHDSPAPVPPPQAKPSPAGDDEPTF